ncbi:uncharacterized protein LOC143022423 isoform X3 [Oratosquilla oratoria]|uniref:uncharacterized protein LOC143022423 isoform X3 n=1 Tax=Oratosquilla oratoria TaxID=337810 RepID=UPI003F758337
MQLFEENTTKMAQSSETAAVRIKQERADDWEINRLALEMAEKNRQKMVSQAAQIAQQTQASQQALQRAGGQQMITYYFNRDKNGKDKEKEDSMLPKKTEEKRTGALDEESQRGRFGWSSIHAVHIPYLFRGEDKYCAVRMVEAKLLNKYLSYLPPEITTCIHVRSYFITDPEAKLLNEINMKHCELQFGRDLFSTKDLVVRLRDARCFYKFLDTCFKKLVQKSPEQSEYCGFVRINGESVVPYTVKDGVKYVPLFYFEGETDTLKLKAEKIDNWELAYLKFCCKVQGIRNELFASETCAVVSLEDVKQYFPKGTQFEDWWPQKTAEPMRVASQGTARPGGNWTQRPGITVQPNHHHSSSSSSSSSVPASTNAGLSSAAQVSMTKSSSLPKAASTVVSNTASSPISSSYSNLNTLNQLNIYSQWASLLNGQAAAAAAAMGSSSSMQAFLTGLSQDQMRRLGSTANPLLDNNMASAARPPPLVRSPASTTSSSSISSRTRSSTTALDATLRQLGYPTSQLSQSALNSLVSGSINNSSIQSYAVSQNTTPAHNTSGSNSSAKVISKAPPPLIPVANGMRSDSNLSSHKGVGRNGLDKPKLVDVPAFRPDPTRNEPPYKAKKVLIDGKGLICINHTAYSHGDVSMVALQDVVKDFIPSSSLSECIEVFQNVLTVVVYKANWHQVKVLMDAWGSPAAPDIVPLVCASDLLTYLTQIKYIFQRPTAASSFGQPTAKRIRTT